MRFHFLLLFTLITAHQMGIAQQVAQRTLLLMGSRFDLTVVCDTEAEGEQYLDAAVTEIQRIEKLISSWDAHSQTSEINRNAGIKPVIVDEELYELIERAIAISKLTDGAFDISYASMDKIWFFDGSMQKMPSKEAIAQSVALVGYNNIELNPSTHSVFLKEKGMKIGFGGIGKGYAADKAKALLQDMGVASGIINASGDMTTWGSQPNGAPWMVAITNPMNKKQAYGTFPIKNGAVVTSGDYEKYVTFNGIRYAHIINPKTGYPATGIISVTVFAPRAELADALATATFVMGIEVGLDRINQIPNVEAIIVDEKGGLHTTNKIKINEN